MKKMIIIVMVTVFTGSLYASTGKKGLLRSLYDVVAPVLGGDPISSDREVGQIFYDNVAGAFKGVNKNGGIDVLTNGIGNLPKVYASTLTGLTTTLETPVIFDVEAYDFGDLYDNTTGTFTATSTGVYSLSITLAMAMNMWQEHDSAGFSVVKNGSEYLHNIFETIWHTQNGIYLSLNADYLLQEGDTIQILAGGDRVGTGALTVPYSGWASFKKLP